MIEKVDGKEKNELELRRSFTYTVDGEEKTFYIDAPTSDQIRKSDWHYSKIYNKALVEGVATRSEIEDILIKRGVIGPDYEKQLQDVKIDLHLKLQVMEQEEESHKKRGLAHEVERLRGA
jgi:hypothetical protein